MARPFQAVLVLAGIAGTLLAVALLAATLLAATGRAAPVPKPGPLPPNLLPPAAGRFLVATHQVGGPYFGRSVVLLLEYDAGGALGLIVNRPTEVPLGRIFPEVAELRERKDPVYLGGPVSRESLMVLLRSEATPEGATPVVDDIHASVSVEMLRRLAGPDPPGTSFHVYVGYAGWSPGQLDNEIARGDWYVVPADADSVFEREAGAVWLELIERHAGRWVRRLQRLPTT